MEPRFDVAAGGEVQPASQPDMVIEEPISEAEATKDYSRELIISLLTVVERDAIRRSHLGEAGFDESTVRMIWQLKKIYYGWISKMEEFGVVWD